MTFGSSYGQTFFVAIFNGEIRSDYGLSHGEIGFYYSIATLLSAGAFAWVGGFVDTVPLKRFSAIVIAGLALAGYLMSVSDLVIFLLLSFLGLRLAGQGLMTHIALTATAKAFRERRGTALSLISLGFPLGQATLPIVGVLLIEMLGWRPAWALLSTALLLILLPAVLFLLRQTAKQTGAAATRAGIENLNTKTPPESETHISRHWTRAEVLKDLSFYLLQPALFALPVIGTGILWNVTLIAEAKAWDIEVIAASLSGLAVTQAVMTLVAGPLIDRFRALTLLPISLLPMIASLLALVYASATYAVFPIMALLGMSFGLVMPVSVAMWAELYGTQYLGAIRSLTHALAVFGTALSPLLMGLLTDTGVAIETTALLLALYGIVSIFLVLIVNRRRPITNPS